MNVVTKFCNIIYIFNTNKTFMEVVTKFGNIIYIWHSSKNIYGILNVMYYCITHIRFHSNKNINIFDDFVLSLFIMSPNTKTSIFVTILKKNPKKFDKIEKKTANGFPSSLNPKFYKTLFKKMSKLVSLQPSIFCFS